MNHLRNRDMGREIFGSDRGTMREREQRDALETRAKLVDTSCQEEKSP
jgi:hypothetical protein